MATEQDRDKKLEQDVGCSFSVVGLSPSELEVVAYEGVDALSSPYHFKVTLVFRGESFSPDTILNQKAVLRFANQEGANSYSGVVIALHGMQRVNDATFFSAELAPRFHWLRLTQHNQIFLGLSLDKIIESVLLEGGVTHYELRLFSKYPPMDYVCQFNESHFDFLSRWMESRGLYYFFEETEQGEKLVVTDTKVSHDAAHDGTYRFAPASNLKAITPIQDILALIREDRIVPQKVLVKDYNYMLPNLELQAEAVVDPNGVGVFYNYGDHFMTKAEGTALAKVRAEGLLAGKTRFRGEGGISDFRAGRLFTLTEHPDKACNIEYLLTSVEYSARLTSYMTAGLSDDITAGERQGARCRFSAISADRQFRPALTTPCPKFHGVINAVIDAETEGKYAQIDSYGRYAVRLPFDLAGRPATKASAWLRLAEPYAGDRYGMHFPLHKGVEVLLTFIDGNPDRPVIASAIHNADKRNMVTSSNAQQSVIKTAGNNQIVMGDEQGKEYVSIYSPYKKSSITVGAADGEDDKPGSISSSTEGDLFTFVEGSSCEVTLGSEDAAIIGQKAEFVVGTVMEGTIGPKAEFNIGGFVEWNKGQRAGIGDELIEAHDERLLNAHEQVMIRAGFDKAFKTDIAALKYAWAEIMLVNAATAASFSMSREHTDQDWWRVGWDVGNLAAIGILQWVVHKQLSDTSKLFKSADTAAELLLDDKGIKIFGNSHGTFHETEVDIAVKASKDQKFSSYKTSDYNRVSLSKVGMGSNASIEIENKNAAEQGGVYISGNSANNEISVSLKTVKQSIELKPDMISIQSQDGKIATQYVNVEVKPGSFTIALTNGEKIEAVKVERTSAADCTTTIKGKGMGGEASIIVGKDIRLNGDLYLNNGHVHVSRNMGSVFIGK